MMRRFLLVGLIVLSGCAPAVNGLNSLGNDGAGLTLERQAELVEVVFTAGKTDKTGVALSVFGSGLAVNDARCSSPADVPAGTELRCSLGTVPAGKAYVLTVRGSSVRAEALWSGRIVPLVGLPKR